MPYQINEQETTISFYRTDKRATVYTCEPQRLKKFISLCETCPEFYSIVKLEGAVSSNGNNEILAGIFSVDKTRIKFAGKKRKGNVASLKNKESEMNTNDNN